MVKLVTSSLVIQAMNVVAQEEAKAERVPAAIQPEEVIATQQSTNKEEEAEQETIAENAPETPERAEEVESGEKESAEEEDSNEDESSEEGEQEEVVTTRAGRRILKPSRF